MLVYSKAIVVMRLTTLDSASVKASSAENTNFAIFSEVENTSTV
jgi:hypothetical protein